MEKYKLTKNNLIEIVKKIMIAEGTDEEISDLMDLFEENVPHPTALDLIFYDERELTPQEIVEEALSYRSNLYLSEGKN